MLGEKIRKLRELKRVSLRDVQKDTGICYGTLHKIEKGERQPKSNALLLLSNYFGVPISYFINDENNILDTKPQQTEQQKNCIDMIMQLDESLLSKAEIYLSGLSARDEVFKLKKPN